MVKAFSLPDDPRMHYVQAEEHVSLSELAQLYRGTLGNSLSSLKARCSKENWKSQRDQFWSNVGQKVDQKAQKKIVEKKLKTITQLNEAHDELIEHILTLGKGLLNGFIGIDPKTGAKKINCKPSEYRAAAQTLIELIKVQRLVHNFEPGKPVIEPQLTIQESVLLETMIDSDNPAQSLTLLLSQLIPQVVSGNLDPNLVSSISTLSNTLMKASQQGELEARLRVLEASLQNNKPEPLELDL